jgi:hypothetical protein
MVKKGDRVVVNGEANEVFTVIGVEDKSVILHSGFAEPIHKCTVIPKKYHDIIYSTIHDYIDMDIMMKIINAE